MTASGFDAALTGASPDQILTAIERIARRIEDEWNTRFGPDGPALDGARDVGQALMLLGSTLAEAVADVVTLAAMVRHLAVVVRDDHEAAAAEQAREDQHRLDLAEYLAATWREES